MIDTDAMTFVNDLIPVVIRIISLSPSLLYRANLSPIKVLALYPRPLVMGWWRGKIYGVRVPGRSKANPAAAPELHSGEISLVPHAALARTGAITTSS